MDEVGERVNSVLTLKAQVARFTRSGVSTRRLPRDSDCTLISLTAKFLSSIIIFLYPGLTGHGPRPCHILFTFGVGDKQGKQQPYFSGLDQRYRTTLMVP